MRETKEQKFPEFLNFGKYLFISNDTSIVTHDTENFRIRYSSSLEKSCKFCQLWES